MKCFTPWLSAIFLSAVLAFPAFASSPEMAPTADAALAPGLEENPEASSTNTGEAPASRGMHVKRRASQEGKSGSSPVVIVGQSYTLKAGETAEEVVVVGGSAAIHGTVTGDLVVVGGSVTLDGKVGGDAVAVLGTMDILDGGSVGGDATAVGGAVNVAEGATVAGSKQGLGLSYEKLPPWLRMWVKECVLKLRPLAPQIGWLWALTGLMFLVYLLIAAAVRRPVQACVDELSQRPATSFLLGLLTKLLLPLILLILAATGLGLFVIPFLLAALLLGGLVGKVALFEAIGRSIGRLTKRATPQPPLLAFTIGFCGVVVLYMIPVIGLLALILISLWGLGAAILACFSGFRRETVKTTTPIQAAAATPGSVAPSPVGDLVGSSSPLAAASPGSAEAPPMGQAPEPPPVVAPPAIAGTRAGFWERMGAAFLDVILVSILGAVVGGPPLGFLVALAYFSGMWAWKGTTIGGIVLGIKVVRLDGRPLTFAVALVRGLAAAFSVIVLFLGFLWIAWDQEKQGWHDRIAGTIVVKMPRGNSLLCV